MMEAVFHGNVASRLLLFKPGLPLASCHAASRLTMKNRWLGLREVIGWPHKGGGAAARLDNSERMWWKEAEEGPLAGRPSRPTA